MTDDPSPERFGPGVMEGSSLSPNLTDTPRAAPTLPEEFSLCTRELAMDAACYHALFEHALDALIHIDASGIITAWNPQAERLFGWPAAASVGKPLADLVIPPRHQAAFFECLSHFLATRHGAAVDRRFETSGLHRDGSEFPVEVTVTVVPMSEGIAFSAIVRDTTHQKQIESDLRLAEHRLGAIIANAPVIVFAAAPGGVISWIQGKALEAIGVRSAEVIGRSIHDVFPNDPQIQDILRRGFQGDTSPKIVELAGQAFEVHQLPHRDDNGCITAIVGVATNVTEHRRAAEELRVTAEALEKRNAELLRSNLELDEFAHIVAHDLKEPLRGMQTYASVLIDAYGDIVDTAGRSRLEALRQLSDRLNQQLEALLEYSRAGSVELAMRESDLNQVVNRALFALGFALQDRRVAVRIPRPLPAARCDPHRVNEVYINLISNAIKYNDKPEKWIEIGWYEREPAVTDVAETPAAGFPSAFDQCGSTKVAADLMPPVFYVRDNGIGIEPQHLGAVFRVFKRLPGSDEYGSGSGMGLTIVKKIVERHGGRVWVESTHKEGSTFFFTLEPGMDNGGAGHDQRQTLSNPPDR